MIPVESGVKAKDLAYVRHRYISIDTLRRAIAIVADGTLQARNPAIWGSGTTACASDSKHYGAWDQNLTTQWHVRYGGRDIDELAAGKKRRVNLDAPVIRFSSTARKQRELEKVCDAR